MNLHFLLPQIAQFHTSINLFCLILLTLEFLFAVLFFTTDTIHLHCFYVIQNQTTLLITRQYFFTIHFIGFDFIVLSDLSSNPNNIIEILFISVFLANWLDYCLMYLNFSLIALKISKSSLSGIILINSKPSYCSIASGLFIL